MSTTRKQSAGKKPSHVAYQVKEIGNGIAYWQRIGVAWTNRDGGLTVQLDSVPLDGRIVCQVPKEKDQEKADQ